MAIRKFVEALDYGRISNRVAYAASADALPPPLPGASWREDTPFREAEATVRDPGLALVLEEARQRGFATVSRGT